MLTNNIKLNKTKRAYIFVSFLSSFLGGLRSKKKRFNFCFWQESA